MQITAIKPTLYNALPEGMPERTLMYDLQTDPHQQINRHEEFLEQAASMNRQIQKWLKLCHPPITSQQIAFQTLFLNPLDKQRAACGG